MSWVVRTTHRITEIDSTLEKQSLTKLRMNDAVGACSS
jgi:hypothetical protein